MSQSRLCPKNNKRLPLFFSMSRAVINGNYSRKGSIVVFRFRYLLLAIVIFAGSFLILSSKNMGIVFVDHNSMSWEHNPYDIDIVNYGKVYTIKTKGCSIPSMEPLNENIETYVHYPKGIKHCKDASLSLLGYNKSTIWIKDDMLIHYNVSIDTLNCCYQAFYRPNDVDDVDQDVDDRVTYNQCRYFKNFVTVKDEFVKVTCKDQKKTVFTQFYPFAPKKSFTRHNNHGPISPSKSAYNILILGIDGVSRLNFHRTMPKTLNYLKKKEVVELLGYNKVGDNTFPNVVPMLMGVSAQELKKICVPHRSAKFDNCPFIWEWFKQAGYYTALGEDNSNIGTFNYQRPGFLTTPTDYYFHTFVHQAENSVGSNRDFNTYLCMNDRHFYKVLLDYIFDLSTNLKDSRLFGFFWEITMSHDYLNYPMVMDNDYVDFFEKLDSSGYLNETIVFILSDHGIRWGGIRSTQQGRLEERLPFTYVLTPPSFRQKYTKAYKHLKFNTQRLTTPYDVYSTLSQLTDLKNIEDEVIETQCKTSYGNSRGISLFLPIPSNRTCKIAGIKDHWCTCYRESVLSKDSAVAVEAAGYLIEHMNKLLEVYAQCARLMLSDIIHVMELGVSKYSQGSNGWREFMVVIRTQPGGGIFEATLRHESKDWRLSGTVSRLNIYGDQSRCVHHNELKLYCFCVS